MKTLKQFGLGVERSLYGILRRQGYSVSLGKGSSSGGDLMLFVGNEEIRIEVKANSGNQVHPYYYYVLVLSSKGRWFVVPADEVMYLAQGKRGQHTPDSFTCFYLSISKVSKFECVECMLGSTIVEAYKSAMKNTNAVLAAGVVANRNKLVLEENKLFDLSIGELNDNFTPQR